MKLFQLTAKGRYYRTYLAGFPQTQHTTEREAIESAQELAFDNPELRVIYVHEYEVEVVATNAGHVEDIGIGMVVDLPPTIISTPSPSFTEGTADTYDMTQHVSDDGVSVVTYIISNILPNGLTFNQSTGILDYDGIGILSVSNHTLIVRDAVEPVGVVSPNFDIVIQGSGIVDGTLIIDGGATPEQLALMVIGITTVSQAATATCKYKKTVDSTWTIGHPLYRVQPSESDIPPVGTVDDVFAWTIIDLLPGTSYDVEVIITDGLDIGVKTLSASTKSLPSIAGTPNKIFAAGTFDQTAINNLSAGDVVELSSGTHDFAGLIFASVGDILDPIYIRGESRTGTIITDSGNGVIFNLRNVSNTVIEFLSISGVGVDGGLGAASRAFYQSDAYTSTNVTLRNITCNGVDRFWDTYNCTSVLIYDNTITGNNEWTPAYNETQIGWGDYGIIFPGTGNCAFNNTIKGFGDTFSCARSSGNYIGISIHYYRNKVRNSVDDFFEADNGLRNVTFYDNHGTNVANLDSVDTFYGGPLIIARNVVINPYRPKPHKWNDTPQGTFLYSNTIVSTVTKSGASSSSEDVAAWYQPGFVNIDYIGLRNNIHVYGGAGKTLAHNTTGMSNIDWSNNAWYPDRQFDIGTLVDGANLAAAQVGASAITSIFSGKQALVDDVIVSSQPFETEVVLGADSATEVTIHYTPRITLGENAKNAGAAIPNITDGYSGAAPDIGALPEGLSIPNYGDRSNIPAYLVAANAFEVIALTGVNSPGANETLEDVLPAEWVNVIISGRTSHTKNIINAWCGGIGASDGKLYIHGGGHSDGAANGIFVYDFIGETPSGYSLVPNSLSAVADVPTAKINHQTYNDGYPTSIHSYDNLSFDESTGTFYRWVGSGWYSGGGSSNGWSHDGASWSSENDILDFPGYESSIASVSVLDQNSRKIMYMRTSRNVCYFYDIANNTWSGSKSVVGSASGDVTYNVLVQDASNKVFLLGDNKNRYMEIDWANETILDDQSFTPTGDTGGLAEYAPAVVYDEAENQFWLYDQGNNTVTSIKADTFVCAETALGGVTPVITDGDYKGTFGRIVWLADYKAIGIVTSAFEPAYIFKVR